MPRISLAVFVSFAFAAPLVAGFSQGQDFRPVTPAETAMTGTSPAAILDWVRVDDNQDAVTSEYYRVKIFNEEGKKYGDVEVAYLPGYPVFEFVDAISARTIQPDGRIVPFHGQVYDKMLMKSGRRMLRAKTFSLPDVQPGSIIEYRFQRRWKDYILFDTTWLVQRDIPVMHAKLSLKPMNTAGQFSSFFTYVGLPAGKVPVRNPATKTYHLELENIPPFAAEAFAPPEEMMMARVNFYYTESRVVLDKFWDAEAARWAKRIENFIGAESAYGAHVPKADDPMEKLRGVYAKAQSLKNLSYDENSSGAENKNALAVLTNGAGYRDEINRAFVGMARAAGFDASVVRVAPRDEAFFSDKLPDANQMGAEVAVVTVKGQPLYLDPGTPGAPFGVVSWEKTNVPGFRVAKGGAVQWLKVAETKPEHAVTHRQADLQLKDGLLEGSITATFHGQEALRRRLRSFGEDEAARKKAFEDEAKGWFADGAEVKLDKIAGYEQHNEPLVATYSVKLPVSSAGSRVVVPLSVFSSTSKNPFAPTTRTQPIYIHYPSRQDDEVKLTLPPAYAPAAIPPRSDLNAGAMSYASETKQSGNEITFKRTMTVDAMLIDTQYYGAVRSFYSNVVAADQKPLVLVSAK